MTSPAQYLASLFSLEGQTAVVIGGSGTLGTAFCEGLAGAGAFVAVAGRDLERAGELAEGLNQAGGSAAPYEVDVCDPDSMNRLRDAVLQDRDRVDMLINNAGVNDGTDYEEVSLEAWERVLQVNLTGTHLGCQTFAAAMSAQETGGSILNIGSVTAHLPLSQVYAYSASKAAVVNLTKNLAREYAMRGVRINALCPGFFPAEQNRAILTEQRVQNIIDGTPMQRFGEPHELIGAMLLLLSPTAGSYITGSAFYVDGGFTAMRF